MGAALDAVFFKVDASVFRKNDPLLLQPFSLGSCAAEGIVLRHTPPAADHPVAGIHCRVGVFVENISHRPCQMSVP